MNSIDSLAYAKRHKKDFTKNVISGKSIVPDKNAIFMAGSPGAGKTEVASSIAMLDKNLCVIDADIFRSQFPSYNGANSSEFQKGASWLVDHVFTFLLKKGYSFILDGTLSISKSYQNIERAINRGYGVQIFYVYQDPMIAWDFTQKREQIEGRFVPKDRFINAYFMARKNIIGIKNDFGEQVELNIVFKNYQNQIAEVNFDTEVLELILPEQYTQEELEKKLHD